MSPEPVVTAIDARLDGTGPHKDGFPPRTSSVSAVRAAQDCGIVDCSAPAASRFSATSDVREEKASGKVPVRELPCSSSRESAERALQEAGRDPVSALLLRRTEVSDAMYCQLGGSTERSEVSVMVTAVGCPRVQETPAQAGGPQGFPEVIQLELLGEGKEKVCQTAVCGTIMQAT